MEGFNIQRVEKITGCSVVNLTGIENKIGTAYNIFSRLAEKNINVIIILQSVNAISTCANIGFVINEADADATEEIIKNSDLGGRLEIIKEVSLLSVSGVGLYHNPDISAKIFEALYDRGIDIHLISRGEMKILAVIDSDRIDEAYKAVSKGLESL